MNTYSNARTARRIVELEARECREIAVHESGHLIIMRLYGVACDARIRRNESGNSREKAWLGQCRRWSEPGEVPWPGMRPAPSNWKTLVGLAGMAAEALDRGTREPSRVLRRIRDAIRRGYASETDVEMIGPAFSLLEVAEVVAILTARWHEIENEAHFMMLAAGATGDNAGPSRVLQMA